MPKPEWLTVVEAARRSVYTVRHVQYLLKQRLLKGTKPARDWFADAESLRAYLRDRSCPDKCVQGSEKA